MLPFWLALAASLLLHAGALLAPGWPLPEEEEPQRFDARLALTPPPSPAAAASSVKKLPPRKKTPAPQHKPLQPPPEAPKASLGATENASVATSVTASESASSSEETALPAAAAASHAPDAVSPAPSFVPRWPKNGRILYQVLRGEQGFVIGQTEQHWEWDELHYQLQTVAETTGVVALFRPARVIQTSRGGFDAFGVRPIEFTVEREGRENESVHFDAEAQSITFSRGGSVPFIAGAQDMLSVFFQLAGAPFDEPEYSIGIATARKLATYRVVVGEASLLETPLGSRAARHFGVHGRPGEEVTEFWLDEETRLPLKIRHRDRKGEVFEQIAIEIDVGNPQDLPR